MKKIIIYICLCFGLIACGQELAPSENLGQNNSQAVSETVRQEKIQVTTSIVPLSSLVNTIGWDYIELNNIVPAGVSPHGFDMSAKQMARVQDSEIVFLTWLEHIDGFLEKAAAGSKQIHLADGIELLEASHDEHSDEHDSHDVSHNEEHDDTHEDEHHDEWHDDDAHESEEKESHGEHKDEDSHDAHDTDPHVWLGKENIISIAQKIRDELSAISPEQSTYFSENTIKFSADLEMLYSDFATQTEGKNPQKFIVFHDAYNYLMQSVGMDLDLKIPFSENVMHETGTAHMAELIEAVKTQDIQYVFKEPQFQEWSLQKFVDEYSLTLGTLDPLGTDPTAKGYLENIQSNLDSLAKVYE